MFLWIFKLPEKYLLVSIVLIFSTFYDGLFCANNFYGKHQFNSTGQNATDSSVFKSLDVSHGGLGVTSLTAFTLIAGGVSPTGSVQSLPSGTAGDCLISSGDGALPIWANPFPQRMFFTLTNNQIKNLRSTPIVVIPAPGPGKIIEIFRCNAKLNYGGHDHFIANSGQDLRFSYGTIDGVSIMLVATNELIVSSSNKILGVFNSGQALIDDIEIINKSVIIFNDSLEEIAGNSSNDNTILLVVRYQIFDVL
jgi:hypothetical protein